LEGKAKLPARSLCTALFVCILISSLTNVSAQDDIGGDRQPEQAIQTPNPEPRTLDTIEDPVEDPNKTAQQSLAFGSPEAAAIPATQGISIFSIFRVLLTLAVVAAAIYGLVYFLKFRRASREKEGQDPFLKILASAPLGASRGVHVISVGPQAWLVGTTENGVTLISEISDKDTINAMLLEDSKRIAMPPASGAGMAGPLLDFKAILGRLGISTKPENSGPDQIRKRSERLKGL
jgi:flagellar protein FliO/FliZ